MKKFMFTALALVAFSGVSMANTIAEEEVVLKLPTCEEICMMTVNAVEEQHHAQTGHCYSSQEVMDLYDSLVAQC